MSVFDAFIKEREIAEKKILDVLHEFEKNVGHNCVSKIHLARVKKSNSVLRVLIDVNVNHLDKI